MRGKSGMPQRHTAFGLTISLTGWSKDERCVVSRETLRRRLMDGWEVESALTSPTGRELHGETGTRMYGVWFSMRARCNTPSSTGYDRYGAKGIRVCPEWDSFTAFKGWALANGYSDDLSIDRIDPKGNYEPDNCQWIPLAENSRRAHLGRIGKPKKPVTAWGETKSRREWIKDERCPHNDLMLLKDRLRHGWKAEDAIAADKGTSVNPKKGKPYTAFGESKSLREWWADERNKCKNWATFKCRVQKEKWLVEAAMAPTQTQYSNKKR